MVRRTNERKERKEIEDCEDCGELLSEHMLRNYSGGLGAGFNNLSRLTVKCPVEGCFFECDTFGEMNLHMKYEHPERC